MDMKPEPKKKIEKISLIDSSIYNVYYPELWKLPDDMSTSTKEALIEIETKINEIIERLNND